MKKLLALFFAFVLLVSLCACGKDGTQTTNPSSSSQVTTGNTEASTGNTENSTDNTEGSTDATPPTTEEPTTPPTTEAPTTPSATQPAACNHSWKAATCAAPKTCTKCGATEGSAAGHNWSAATCTAPKTCAKCGTTEGSAAGHNWSSATCTAPKSCSKCSATEGNAAGHSYQDGACTVCGAADPNVPFTGNEWTAHIVRPSGYTDPEAGDVLSIFTLKPTGFQGYAHKDYYSNENYGSGPFGSITYNGKTYYDHWSSSNYNGIAWEDNGDTVTVTFPYEEPVTELVLTRTGETQFTVTSSNSESIPVGTVFAQD